MNFDETFIRPRYAKPARSVGFRLWWGVGDNYGGASTDHKSKVNLQNPNL
jgi:hypothetical protein